jgi:hypothetical protein
MNWRLKTQMVLNVKRISDYLNNIPNEPPSFLSDCIFYIGKVVLDKHLNTIPEYDDMYDAGESCARVLYGLYDRGYIEAYHNIEIAEATDYSLGTECSIIYISATYKNISNIYDLREYIKKIWVGLDGIDISSTRDKLIDRSLSKLNNGSKCECGAHKTYGQDCNASAHYRWCRLYRDE